MSVSTFSDRLVNSLDNSIKSSFDINGMRIICRSSDGYVNANQLCKAAGRDFNTWKRGKEYQPFIRAVSESLQICNHSLIRYEDHGPQNRATWVHPRVAIGIAFWASCEFAATVTGWIHELLVMGSVTYGKELSNEQVMQEQITQMKNTIDQQVAEILAYKNYVVQQDYKLVEKDTIIQYKDDKIDNLQADIQKLIQQNEESRKEAEETRKRLEEMFNSTNEQLALTHTKLTVTHDQTAINS